MTKEVAKKERYYLLSPGFWKLCSQKILEQTKQDLLEPAKQEFLEPAKQWLKSTTKTAQDCCAELKKICEQQQKPNAETIRRIRELRQEFETSTDRIQAENEQLTNILHKAEERNQNLREYNASLVAIQNHDISNTSDRNTHPLRAQLLGNNTNSEINDEHFLEGDLALLFMETEETLNELEATATLDLKHGNLLTQIDEASKLLDKTGAEREIITEIVLTKAQQEQQKTEEFLEQAFYHNEIIANRLTI